MTSTTLLPLLRIRSAGDLLDAVPYLLGFHPSQSLVLVGLADHRVCWTIRADLEGLHLPAVLDLCQGATELVAAVYTDDADGAVRTADLADQLEQLARDAVDGRGEPELVDCLLVRHGRWWSVLCPDPSCCPPEGRELGGASSEAAATATVAGMVAFPDRGALGTQLGEPDAQTAARLCAIIEDAVGAAQDEHRVGRIQHRRRCAVRALFAAARRAENPRWGGLGEDELVDFAVALADTPVRDTVWLAVDGGRLAAQALWQDLAGRLPAPWSAAPLFVFGWSAWRSGNGALARIATDRALMAQPGYSGAALLLGALDSGINPRLLPKLRRCA